MKGKSAGVKKLFLVLLSLSMFFVAYLSLRIRKFETPVQLYKIIDGNTIVFSGGKTVRLMGIDASAGGQANDQLIKQYLSALLSNKNVWLEYDRYMKDTSGFDLVWVWVGCEDVPKFWAIRKVDDNPVNCEKGALVNEQIVKMGWVKTSTFGNASLMRYGDRLLRSVR